MRARRLLGLLLFTVACGAPAPAAPTVAPTAPTAAPLTHVTTAYSTTSTSDLPLWVARESGLFAQHGLDVDVQLIQNPGTTAALLAGQIDVAFEGVSDMLGPVNNGADLVILANLVPTPPYVFEVGPSIQSVQDLKGAKLGASQAGGSDYVALRAVLKQLGLDPATDVDIVFVGGVTDRTAALLGGSAVGTLTAPPETLTLEKQGFHPLLDLTTLHLSAVNAGVVVKRTYTEDHRAALQQFMQAILEAIALEKRDRALTEGVMQKYLKLSDRAQLDAAYDFFVGKLIPDVPMVSTDQFAQAIDTIAEKDPTIRNLDLHRLVDTSFLPAQPTQS
jgi:NitT/TauT family transport system substrate-binding protein